MSLVGTALALGILGGSGGLYLSKGQKRTQNLFTGLKNALTNTAMPSLRPRDYTSVQEVIAGKVIEKPPNKLANSILKRFKIGHIFSAAWALVAGTPFIPWVKDYLSLDEDSLPMKAFKIHAPFAIVGSLASFLTATFCRNDIEDSMVDLIDNYVTRKKVTKDKKVIDPRTGAVISNEGYVVFKDVILDDESRLYLRGAVDSLRSEGRILNLWGITGTGKTMTANSLADLIMQQQEEDYTADSVQIWEVSTRAMEKLWADEFKGTDWLRELPIIGQIFGETIPQRLERLVAHAVKHYRDTGEYVVLVFNESQELVGSKSRHHSSNVFNRNPLHDALQRFFDGTILTPDCKGVMLAMTNNCKQDQFPDTMYRRLISIEYKRPTESVRKELIQSKIESELERAKNNSSNSQRYQGIKFDEDDFKKLAASAAYKLKQGGSSDFSSSGEIKRDVLHHSAITQAIELVIRGYHGGEKEQLMKDLDNVLTKRANAAAAVWLDEVRDEAPDEAPYRSHESRDQDEGIFRDFIEATRKIGDPETRKELIRQLISHLIPNT